MNEAEFYRTYVAPKLSAWGDHSRIENSLEGGTPDISYAITGVQGWIETKIIHSGKMSFEKFQLPWLRKRLRHAEGNLFIFATDQTALYVYGAGQVLKAKATTYRKWTQVAIADIEKPVVYGPQQPWPWGEVLLLLTKDKIIRNRGSSSVIF